MSHAPKTEIVTFGCRLNIYESEAIKEILPENLDEVIIFNTCAVTSEAERQARQAIRKNARENPNKKIIVTGCAAQINPSQFEKMPEVDFIIGNHEKMQKNIYDSIAKSEMRVIVNDIMSIKDTASHMISSFEGKIRAFLQIQNGCNHRCTFCTIPYGRGNNRSVPVSEIINQINMLVDNEVKEIVLTGVDITDYGLDLPGTPKIANLIKRILKLTKIERIRISSIDVAEIDQELLELIISEKRIMPYIHISLQSGDDMILKRMKRRHNRAQILEFCKNVQINRPEIIFGADIIAGFPTENDLMFQNTLRLIYETNLSLLHVFPYSERSGTPAANMPQVPKNIRKERAKILRQAGGENLKKQLENYVGREVKVLFEKKNFGKTDNFLPVKFEDNNYQIGEIITITPKKIDEEKMELIA